MLAIQIEIRDSKTIIMPAINHTISVIIARVNVTMVIQMVGRSSEPLLGIPGESLVTFGPMTSRLRRGAWTRKGKKHRYVCQVLLEDNVYNQEKINKSVQLWDGLARGGIIC